MYRVLTFKSRWGWMALAESERGLSTIVLPQASKAAAEARLPIDPGARSRSSSAKLQESRKQLTEYLAGVRTSFDVPLDLTQGTPFQQRVWKMLRAIPYGELWSYRGLASRVGGVEYARAVGGAVGANPLPIMILAIGSLLRTRRSADSQGDCGPSAGC